MKRTAIIFCLLVLALTNLLSQQSYFPKLIDLYLEQKLPGMILKIFAPGIILVEIYNHSPF
jgi:hypothetical protein